MPRNFVLEEFCLFDSISVSLAPKVSHRASLGLGHDQKGRMRKKKIKETGRDEKIKKDVGMKYVEEEISSKKKYQVWRRHIE